MERRTRRAPRSPLVSRSNSAEQSPRYAIAGNTKELLEGERFGTPDKPQVFLRVCVLNIYEISAQDRTWQGKIDLEASWHDPTLNRDKQEQEVWPDTNMELWPKQCPFVASENKRWTPRLNLANLLEKKAEETWYKVYTHHDKDERGIKKELAVPLVVYRVVLHGVFTLEFRPQRFPFDVQELPVKVVSNREISDDPRFARLVFDTRVKYQSKVFGGANLLAGEWDLDGTLWISQGEMPQRTASRAYPVVLFTLKLHRRAGFYVYSIWLPNFVLVTLAFLVLTLEAQNHERVNLVLTLLLTSIGYRANVNDQLPRTSTFSWLEGYLLLCIATLFSLALFAYGLLGEAKFENKNVTVLSVPYLCLCLGWGFVRDQDWNRGVFVTLAAAFGYLTIDLNVSSEQVVHQVYESLNSPAEVCFFLWLLGNVALFMLYCEGALQPTRHSHPEQIGSIEAPRPIDAPRPAGARAALPAASRTPLRAATSPARAK